MMSESEFLPPNAVVHPDPTAIDRLETDPFAFGKLTFREIRQRAESGWHVIVPTGCTEQQGPHLPVDFDTWFSEKLMLTTAAYAFAAHGLKALVLPALPFGPTPEHRGFGAGYINIAASLHEQLILSVLRSLANQGFQRLIVWQGCGGHRLETAIDSFNQQQKYEAQAWIPPRPFHDVWCRIGDPAVPGGHADSYTTSIAMYLRPQDVREARIFRPDQNEIDWNDPDLDLARYTPTGVIGDPTHATPELGARLWRETVIAAADSIIASVEHDQK